jgi:hypothetical protein
MPDPDKLLTTLRRAAVLFRAQPGRRGRVVTLGDASDVLVAGDLHGHLPHFQAVLQRANLAANPRRHLIFQELIHGPHRYPAGGDKSHQLVDLLAVLKCQYPNRVHMILGNHELAQATGRLIAKAESDLNAQFREGVGSAYGLRGKEVYQAYMDLFAAIPVVVRTANRVFLSHSLPSARALPTFRPSRLELEPSDPFDLGPGGAVHALVWGRDTEPEHVVAFLKTVDADWLITGHISCPEQGFAVPNLRQLIIDSGGPPGTTCLVPADRPVTLDDLISGLKLL